MLSTGHFTLTKVPKNGGALVSATVKISAIIFLKAARCLSDLRIVRDMLILGRYHPLPTNGQGSLGDTG